MKFSFNSLLIVLGIIISSLIFAHAYKYKFRSTETLVVTGLAEKDFTSDEIVWKGSFTRTGMDLKDAYASLKADETEIRRYLTAQQIPDSAIIFSSVDVQKNFETRYDNEGRVAGSSFSGYTLTGEVTVNSRSIALVETISRQVTELLQKGIEFSSRKPDYYYSRLNELKIDLLAKAAQDAKLRAETIAKNSGVGLGNMKKANMGVFQITGKNNNEEYSYGGSFNTTSKEKTASITLRVEYIVE
jgi:hypothetical protein